MYYLWPEVTLTTADILVPNSEHENRKSSGREAGGRATLCLLFVQDQEKEAITVRDSKTKVTYERLAMT